MAKATRPKKTKVPLIPGRGMKWDILLVELVSRFGLSSTIIIILLYNFIANGSIEQKREFIDKYILLKYSKDEPRFFYYVIILILLSFYFTIRAYKRRLILKNERIRQLEDDLKKVVTKPE